MSNDVVPLPLNEAFRIAEEYQQAGRLDDAEALLKRILTVAPLQPDSLHMLGLVRFRQGHAAEAVSLIERAIAHGVETALYNRNLCAIHESLGQLEAAVAAGERAVALDPFDAESFHNLTVAHYRRLALDECEACARRAIALDPARPAPHFALAELLLLRGAFADGWREYEYRFRLPGIAPPIPGTDRPAWDGSPMPDATLMLVADQGYGDSIQFCRYIPWAAAHCPRLVLACSAELQPLLRQAYPSLPQFSTWRDAPPFAAWSALSSLPGLHGTTLDTIPQPGAYLHADPARAEAWRQRLSALIAPNYRRIGIVWSGRPAHPNDINRSARLDDFAPIAALPGIALVSLQKGTGQAQIGSYPGRAPLVNIGSEVVDFADTAAVVADLDLVITVDTAVAHLAAALGKPTWIMLPFAPDWRWLLGRPDSPWYGAVRLFRQTMSRDWRAVTEAIAAALGGAAPPSPGPPACGRGLG